MIPSYAIPKSDKEVVLERHTKPDDLGRVQFTIYWRTNYIPGRPEGEYPDPKKGEKFLVRGQVFFTDPKEITKHYTTRGLKVRELEVTL